MSEADYQQIKQSDRTGALKKKRRFFYYFFRIMAIIIVFLIIIIIAPFALSLVGKNVSLTPTPTLQHSQGSGGISAEPAHNGAETIGISDGSYTFDTDRPDGNAKQAAADQLRNHNTSGAIASWTQARQVDPTDAEARIYLEDQNVLSSGHPYITVIVATILSGPDKGVGAYDLQGAYVAQEEYNTAFKLNAQGGGWQVRVLVANSGSHMQDSATIAEKIIQVAKSDPTFVGVIGWPFSDQTLTALNLLKSADIPMISYGSSDALTNNAPHLFRVTAPANVQAKVAATYAIQTLHATSAVVFVDPNNSDSNSLANDFIQQFRVGQNVTTPASYTVGQSDTVAAAFQQAVSAVSPPDLIYFAGYASDVSPLLASLSSNAALARVKVLGPDSLYELANYPDTAYSALPHLRLTSFAYPDEWGILHPTAQQPAFLVDYNSIFDSDRANPGKYSYGRPNNDTMLAYDGTIVMLQASAHVLQTSAHITHTDLQDALTQITGDKAVQGVTGQISFGSDGDAIQKEVMVLCVSVTRTFHLLEAQGQFLVGSPVMTYKNLTSECS